MQIDIMSARTPVELAEVQGVARRRGRRVPPRVTVESSEKKTEMIEELETMLQRITPGFGFYAEVVSIKNMKSFVKQCGFAFYSSRGNPRQLLRHFW